MTHPPLNRECENLTLRYILQHLIRVPVFKEQRYTSIPLSGGSAEPFEKSEAPPINIVRHVDGQYLSGDMIPRRENSQAEMERRKKVMAASTVDAQSADLSFAHRSKPVGELTPLLEGDENGYASA